MSFTVIVPFYNEEENIDKLFNEIFNSIKNYKSFQIILINDGSSDKTIDHLKKIENNFPSFVKIINNNINIGQSYSLIKGISLSKYDTIVTLDGDGQNNPADIPKLLKEYMEGNYFLVGGLRLKRKDSNIKKLSSKLANKIRNTILKDDCVDTGCSLKVFSKKVFIKFPEFNGIHRFLPALFRGFGYKAKFLEVDHRHRVFGSSKYGTIDRLIKGVIDLLRVYLIIKNSKRNVK